MAAAATAPGSAAAYMNPMAALATQIPHGLNGTGQPPSLPSPTMPNFNMGANTPNGQPGGAAAAAAAASVADGVFTNGIPQTAFPRKSNCSSTEQISDILFLSSHTYLCINLKSCFPIQIRCI